jgi:threonine/homoserine/homoserine lactone efflux protein
MGTSALAAFTSLEANFLLQVAIVAGTFLVITIPSAGIWLIFGAGLQHVLKDPDHLRIFNLAMAVLLVASILPVIWEVIT